MAKKFYYVGNCVNSFDEDGENIVNQLPFNDVNDFAVAEENAKPISKEVFNTLVANDEMLNKKHEIVYGIMLKYVDFPVVYAYDTDDDIHYFYV